MMLTRTPLPLLLVAAAAFASTAAAVPITFDLRDRLYESEITSGTITRDEVTAWLSPHVAGATGILNQTNDGFGINATGSGDDTDALDDDQGAESIELSFSADVAFTQLTLSLFTPNEDAAQLTIADFGPIALPPQAARTDVYTFNSDNLVLAGQTVTLDFLGGNGFSFDSFSIETDVPTTGVPDSGSTAVLLAGALTGLFGLGVRRSRQDCAVLVD